MHRVLIILCIVKIFCIEIFPSPITISITQHLGELGLFKEYPRAYPMISITDKEFINNANITVDFSPFIVIEIKSVDERFSASFYKDNGNTFFSIWRVSQGMSENDNLIEVTLDSTLKGNEGLFGEFPIKNATLWDNDKNLLDTINTQNGSWYIFSDLYYSTKITVLDKLTLEPIRNVILVAEWIGRAGLFYFDKTDDEGIAKIPFRSLYSNENPIDYLPDLHFSAQYITPLSARIVVWPYTEKYHIYNEIHVLEFSEEFVQDFTVYLTPLSSQVVNFALYE